MTHTRFGPFLRFFVGAPAGLVSVRNPAAIRRLRLLASVARMVRVTSFASRSGNVVSPSSTTRWRSGVIASAPRPAANAIHSFVACTAPPFFAERDARLRPQ